MMNPFKKASMFFLLVLLLTLFLTASIAAQNKVVVIPLMETATVEPFAPLAAENPLTSDYYDNTFGGHVTDKVTGLVWQKSDDDVTKDWQEAWDYCRDLTLPAGGWTDWRLPSIDELMSIVDYGANYPSINSVFWGTKPIPYWSATTYAPTVNSQALWIMFNDGTVQASSKGNNYYVRCVRRLTSVRDNSLKNNGDGTVSDLTTGLMWQRETDNAGRPWDQANSYCQELSLGGKQDWRLPNVKELQSIADYRVVNPAIDAEIFPNHRVLYWSSTSDAESNSVAWHIWSNNGWTDNIASKDFYCSVRCVR